MRILVEPQNALVKQYTRLFEIDGIYLEFDDSALKEVVKQARKKKTGARALRSIMEESMLDIMFELPSMDDVNMCVITEGVILKREKPIYQYRENSKRKSRA